MCVKSLNRTSEGRILHTVTLPTALRGAHAIYEPTYGRTDCRTGWRGRLIVLRSAETFGCCLRSR
ncbi:hypothetical protein FBZ33_3406 [Micromonospora sp. A202]|nr:hypothetical protein FBZ33_3406 [Micromonospora sp. A202]